MIFIKYIMPILQVFPSYLIIFLKLLQLTFITIYITLYYIIYLLIHIIKTILSLTKIVK
jgi:hypothetical protein